MEISVDTGDRCYQYKYLSGYHDIILYYIYYFLFLYFLKMEQTLRVFIEKT